MTLIKALFVVLICALVETEGLKIENNRYDDLVVAISPEVNENYDIITNIKKMISDASPYLFEATRKRAYFGNVKIVVPGTWNRAPSWVSSTIKFEEADIRIDNPHPLYGNDPYTFQPERCGDPGQYIHLTDHYVRDPDHKNIYTYGPSGRVLVHEFSHLRYGVFDEYGLGTDAYPYYYIEDGTVYPTACTDGIRGINNGECKTNPVTNLPENCSFIADADQNTVKASVMYDVGVNSVTTFCESNAADPEHAHNKLAPNLQNRMCNMQGTWDVIKEHKDFKAANLPTNKNVTELTPTFTILHSGGDAPGTTAGSKQEEECGRPVVLVLDVSGSMDTNNRLFRQLQASDMLIKDILPKGTKLGIVQFGTVATKLLPLTALNAANDRTVASNQVPRVTSGSTSIGSGLRMATQMLVAAGAKDTGRIVLITDGEENQAPMVVDVMGEVKAAGIRVHAIAYSAAASEKIRELTDATGGKYTFYSESADSTQLQSAMEEFLKDISVCSEENRIQITRKAEELIANKDSEGTVTIDSTLRNDTMFVFTLPKDVNVMVTLKSPRNTVYDQSSPEYSKDAALNIVRFNFPFAQTGTWHYILRGNTAGPVAIVVKALPDSKQSPYEVTSWFSSTLADLTTSSSKPVVVYVHVHKGYSPVVSAKVTVKVERPSATAITLHPLDNGKGADTLVDDGVYSAYFTQFSTNARYSLDVSVESISGNTSHFLPADEGTVAYGKSLPRFHNTTKPPQKVLTDNFTRTTSPGAMDVHGFNPKVDQIAPSRIEDLKVVAFDSEAGTVTLVWTAPGDDLDFGTASDYEIRLAKTAAELIVDFPSNLIVNPSMVVAGSLKPQAASTDERITIKTPDGWTTVAFAMKALDETGNSPDPSNTASATFETAKMSEQFPKPPIPTEKAPSRVEEPDRPNAGIIVGAVLGGLVLGALFIGVGCKLYMMNKADRVKRFSVPKNVDLEHGVPNTSFEFGNVKPPISTFHSN